MRIVFTNPVGIMGGGERALLTMQSALRRVAPDLELLLLVGTDGPLVEQAQQLGVQVTVLPLPDRLLHLGDSGLAQAGIRKLALARLALGAIPALATYLQNLDQVLRQLAPDVIHSNGLKTHLLLGCLRSRPAPVLWHIHDFYSTRPLMAKGLRWLQRSAVAGIGVSAAVAQDSRSVLPGLPIVTIPNAIDTEEFSPGPEEPLIDRPLHVGLVATFAHWKGHRIFLQAAAQVHQRYPQARVKFFIIGDAIYRTAGSQVSRKELQQEAERLGVGDWLTFLGFQTDMPAVYRSLDIVVHASTQPEPFGLVIAEAMACGRAVIVAAAGGAAELFIPGQEALGVPPGDGQALAEAIGFLLNHPEQRRQIGQQSRRAAVERFNPDRLANQLLGLYRQVAGQSEGK